MRDGVEHNKINCPQCNKLIDISASFCTQCGRSLTKSEPDPPVRTARPLGVWLFTIYFGLVAGILPVFAVVALMAHPETREMANMILPELLFSILLGVAIVVTAYLTWSGNNRGRIIFLVLITIYYVLIAYNNASLLEYVDTVPRQNRMMGRVFRGFLYPVITILYFTRPKTVAFYSQSGKTHDQHPGT